MRKTPQYEENVFINCPLDKEYKHLFIAIVFTVHSLGFRPVCIEKSARDRKSKLFQLIHESKYSIYDFSRTNLSKIDSPLLSGILFELGFDLGCREFNDAFKDKEYLLLNAKELRFRDLKGVDYKIRAHGDDAKRLINIISVWLRPQIYFSIPPNAAQIYRDYEDFKTDYLVIENDLGQELAFTDFSETVADWIIKMREIDPTY